MSRGFSLIEVLIAIVVLALGLLGLAAVFPVVLTQQRDATDTVQGVSAARSVGEYLAGHGRLNQKPAPNADQAIPGNRRGWGVLTRQGSWSALGGWTTASLVGDLTQIPAGAGLGLNPSNGWMAVGQAGGVTILLPLADRLMPMPYTTLEDPRFVWDFAARRVDVSPTGVRPATTGLDDDQVQVAIFVRRIDSSIRRAGDRTLREVFLNDTLPAGQRRVPVAVDARGRPTQDGQGGGASPNYSPIISFAYAFAPAPDNPAGASQIEWIVPDASNGFNDLRGYVSQVGQKFVTQMGTVHEVVEVRNPGAAADVRLRVQPGIDARLGVDVAALPEGELRLLGTPQVPAAVVVRTMRP
jgi:prepilin-type N-terminal cleavage/methylation domain-containing protein